MDDEALGSDAGLAVVDVACGDRGPDGGVQIRAGHNDERIGAAELHDRLLDVLAGLLGDLGAGGVRAGQSDRLDAVIGYHGRDSLGAHQQGLKGAFGEAGSAKDLLQGKRAARDVGSMLEQPYVARHQGWSRKAHDLPEREVPRHHREDWPQRQVADVALVGIGLDRLVREKAGAVFCEKAAARSAFLRLRHGRLVGLAHFLLHQARPLLALVLQDLRGFVEPTGALGKGSSAVCAEGLLRPLQGPLQIRIADLLEAFDELAGGWIDTF